MFNKAVLDQMKFPYPMFLTTYHMIFATILTQFMSRFTSMLPGVKEVLQTCIAELRAEAFARPGDSAFHGAHGNAQNGGDFFVGHVLDVAQHEDLAVLR